MPAVLPEELTAMICDGNTWERVDALGLEVDRRLAAGKVGLTTGGEPTFVAEDENGPEWRTAALGVDKEEHAHRLLLALRERLQPRSLVHFGVGKRYPGESLPRWVYGCYWRRDGKSVWEDQGLLALDDAGRKETSADARRLLVDLVGRIGLDETYIVPVIDEDVPAESGYALPLLMTVGETPVWSSCAWELPGPAFARGEGRDLGLRLPLDKVPWRDTLATEVNGRLPLDAKQKTARKSVVLEPNSIRVALCVQARNGILRVFMPPFGALPAYQELLHLVQESAAHLGTPLRLEGFPPPADPRLLRLQLTPDPGVLEVNLPPLSDWPELKRTVATVYACAARCSLRPFRYLHDGRLRGTGGGSHITLGGARPEESPFLRRPELLTGLIRFWQNHPALSYAFTGLFAGPTCQAPRVDEARQDSLYELEIALERGSGAGAETLAQALENLLVDVAGNGHRAELCVDKLWPAAAPQLRFGVLELRAFEMPWHPRCSLVLHLLVRSLLLMLWEKPCGAPLKRWGTVLHDRYALPYFLARDLEAICAELSSVRIPFKAEWLEPLLEFRFPVCALMEGVGWSLEVRHALEFWPALQGRSDGGTSRPVDSSSERLQLRLRGAHADKLAVLCNSRRVPLEPTADGDFVAGVRFNARDFFGRLHPYLPVQAPLLFQVIEKEGGRLLMESTFHPEPERPTVNDLPEDPRAAKKRLQARFRIGPQRQRALPVPDVLHDPEYPLTLDLRRPGFFSADPKKGA